MPGELRKQKLEVSKPQQELIAGPQEALPQKQQILEEGRCVLGVLYNRHEVHLVEGSREYTLAKQRLLVRGNGVANDVVGETNL